MEKFREIKNEILCRGYEAKACDEIKRAEDSESMEELAQVIKDNFEWCVYKRVLDTEIISKYEKEFAGVGIYANESRRDGYVVIDSEVDELSGNAIAILYDNATVNKVYGNATVSRVFGNANVNEVSGNATVNEVYGNAYISVYSYIECKISDHAIMRVRSENKIYTNTEVERPNNN